MRLFIDTSHQLILEGLTAILTQNHKLVSEAFAEVAIRDLWNVPFSVTRPGCIPTLALIGNQSEDAIVQRLLRLGYRGYLRPTEGKLNLERALSAIRKGEIWAERHILTKMIGETKEPTLTPRESELFDMITRGLSNQDIAQELSLSVSTVKGHTSKLLKKFAVKNRNDLINRIQLYNCTTGHRDTTYVCTAPDSVISFQSREQSEN